MTLIFRGTHTDDPHFNERVDHGRLTQSLWWPHRITLIVRDMATEFVPMQVNDTHIPWHTEYECHTQIPISPTESTTDA